jgi:hypothetical protein
VYVLVLPSIPPHDCLPAATAQSTAGALLELRRSGERLPGEHPARPRGDVLRTVKRTIDERLEALRRRRQELELDLLPGWGVAVHRLGRPPPRYASDPPATQEDVCYWRLDAVTGEAKPGTRQLERPFVRSLETVRSPLRPAPVPRALRRRCPCSVGWQFPRRCLST